MKTRAFLGGLRLVGWMALALVALVGGSAFANAPTPASDAGVDPSPFEKIYDPYEGMDESGRIPAVEKPPDLPNPDRWRYIPEGRIKPGNFFERFLVTSFVVPVVFRDPDTGTGGGLGITDIDFRGQRRREFAGFFVSYTSKGQQSYWGLWRRWLHHREREGGGVFQEERSFVGISGGFQKTLTRRFFGFGADSDQDDEIKYTDKLLELELELEMAIPDPGANLVGTLGLRGEYHSLSTNDFDCDEVFQPKDACPSDWDNRFLFGRGVTDLSGTPDTTTNRLVGIQNSQHERTGYLVAGLRWDTRDSQRNPYGGYRVGLLMDAPLVQDNGNVGARFRLDSSAAFPVPGIFHSGAQGDEENPPTDVIAIGGSLWHSVGDMPFTGLPNLGGSETLRGYQSGRFRDEAAWHVGIEHRIWVISRGFEITPTIRVERIGIAPFVEAGSVGGNAVDAVSNKVRYSYGVGLRILLERAAPFRVDFGFSEEGFQWTARFGYTF